MRRTARSWLVRGALAAVAVAGLWCLVVPPRVHDVVSVDDQYRWDAAYAPPRYLVLWRPALPVAVPVSGVGGSLIRPQLGPDGTELYFTLRTSGSDADIYRSRLKDGTWQPAEPVAELNTPADDIGPSLRADGRQLYLYSNRPGGYGGFDLYVANREGDRWDKPRNLGPRINSPAQEYDPAVTPDGTRLFFASNRTLELNRRLAESAAGEPADRWPATLRADLVAATFDLYQARRDAPNSEWSPAEPLHELNRPNSSEGAPCVSPSGSFLYFASNRPARAGEEPNFDIYRARLRDGRITAVEDLGGGVNSRANEIEPSLSPEGFRLYFSRDEEASQDRPASERRYALYRSDATEIVEQKEWGENRLSELTAFVARSWWWLLAFLLTAAFLASLAWYLRQVSLRRLPVPGFFLIALAIHVLLGTGSFYVHLGEGIVRQIHREIEQVFAARLEPQGHHQSHQPGQGAYEKVADLRAVETVEPGETPRQVTELPSVPVPPDSPAPEVPLAPSAQQPPDRLVVAPPKSNREMLDARLARRRPIVERSEEAIRLEQPSAADRPQPKPVERVQVEIQRRPAPMDVAGISRPLEVQPPQMSAKPSAEMAVERRTSPELPATVPAVENPAPAGRKRPVPGAADLGQSEAVENVPLAPAVEAPPKTPIEQVPVELQRREAPALVASIPVPLPPRALAEPSARPSGTASERPTTPSMPAAPLGAVNPPAVSRRQPLPTSLGQDEAVESVPLGPAAAESPQSGSVALTGRPDLDIARRETGGPSLQGPPPTVAATSVRPAPDLSGARGPGSADRPAVLPTEVKPGATPIAPSLARARSSQGIEDAPVPLETTPAGPPAPTSSRLAGMAGLPVGVDRADARLLQVNVQSRGKTGGLYDPRRANPVVGSLERETVDAPPSFSPIASRISRRPARAPQVLYAEDAIGLQAMFGLRQGEMKRDAVTALGGSDQSLDAVRRGLEWLARHQHADGYWSLHAFYNKVPGKNYGGQGGVRSDAAATGFALLPFLGDGHTPLSGQYQPVVRKGIDWLIKRQSKPGELSVGESGNTRMYAHAIATIGLCEAYGMSRDSGLQKPAQRAVDFIVSAQHLKSGGWRYQPNQAADTSVVGWQVMALKSGQMAGLQVPQDRLELVKKWLASVEGAGINAGRFSYQMGRPPTPAMTAEALLCLQYLGTKRDDPRLQSGAKHLLQHLPKRGSESSYYWYYGTQVMYHLQGEPWERWNAVIRDLLVQTQIKDGHLAGTWDPKDQWENQAGRIYATALRLLMLEVYYRHLPLYQVLAEK